MNLADMENTYGGPAAPLKSDEWQGFGSMTKLGTKSARICQAGIRISKLKSTCVCVFVGVYFRISYWISLQLCAL